MQNYATDWCALFAGLVIIMIPTIIIYLIGQRYLLQGIGAGGVKGENERGNKMPTDQELIKIVPSSRQLAYQATEFYAFFHFGMNTYTNREWGDGTETPQIFNPTEFVADQWVSAAQNAGMKGVILTCKHHDGFCLWPTRYTSQSVVYSPCKI